MSSCHSLTFVFVGLLFLQQTSAFIFFRSDPSLPIIEKINQHIESTKALLNDVQKLYETSSDIQSRLTNADDILANSPKDNCTDPFAVLMKEAVNSNRETSLFIKSRLEESTKAYTSFADRMKGLLEKCKGDGCDATLLGTVDESRSETEKKIKDNYAEALVEQQKGSAIVEEALDKFKEFDVKCAKQ